jgi:uncharacterized protein
MVEQIKPQYSINWITNIAEIPQQEWDNLAKPLKTPFLEWEWLNNLETSGSAKNITGWQPCHLTIWQNRQLIAAAPLYIKNHSYGEFVFDHQWAELAHRLGISYYPKLIGMTPFTPVEGYRFLISPSENEEQIMQIMMTTIDNFCQKNNLGGCHFLFVDPQWKTKFERHGFIAWLHHSYIWGNKNFQSFDDYLQVFNANQRRNIKRERKAIIKADLEIKVFQGEEILPAFFPLIYRFYSNTCDKFYWGSKYLTRQFFEQLYPNYLDRVILFVAFTKDNPDNPIGMSFCIHKNDQLYGRYWGSFEEYDCLHFEACYYQPIEWAISQNIQLFDPGAGGQHKKRRGFPATPNHSLHRFYNPRMTQILHAYIEEINQMEQEEIEEINQDLPFNQHNS